MLPGTRLFFDQEEVAAFHSLVGKFGSGALASPNRSTVPLLSLVKDSPALFADILGTCGCDGPLSIHFEYQVPVPGVKGNASQTDAMVVSSKCTVAVEAKWTEPRYESVAGRLESRIRTLMKEDPQNADKHVATQRAVIQAWLGLLSRRASAPLGIDQCRNVVYQMIHRAASACHMPGSTALLYLHFEPSPAKGAAQHADYAADLAHLRDLLGKPAEFPFYLVTLPLRLRTEFAAIANLPRRMDATDDAVRQAIVKSKLFDFGVPKIDCID